MDIGVTDVEPATTIFFISFLHTSVPKPTVVFTTDSPPALLITLLVCFKVFFSELLSVENVADFKSLLIADLAPSIIEFAVFPPINEPVASITTELRGLSPAIVVIPFDEVISTAASTAIAVAIVDVFATVETPGIPTAPVAAEAPTLVQSMLPAASQKPCPCIVIFAVI